MSNVESWLGVLKAVMDGSPIAVLAVTVLILASALARANDRAMRLVERTTQRRRP